MVHCGVLLLFLLNSIHVDFVFLRIHFDKDKDDAKTTEGKTRLTNYVFDDAKLFQNRSVHQFTRNSNLLRKKNCLHILATWLSG